MESPNDLHVAHGCFLTNKAWLSYDSYYDSYVVFLHSSVSFSYFALKLFRVSDTPIGAAPRFHRHRRLLALEGQRSKVDPKYLEHLRLAQKSLGSWGPRSAHPPYVHSFPFLHALFDVLGYGLEPYPHGANWGQYSSTPPPECKRQRAERAWTNRTNRSGTSLYTGRVGCSSKGKLMQTPCCSFQKYSASLLCSTSLLTRFTWQSEPMAQTQPHALMASLADMACSTSISPKCAKNTGPTPSFFDQNLGMARNSGTFVRSSKAYTIERSLSEKATAGGQFSTSFGLSFSAATLQQQQGR